VARFEPRIAEACQKHLGHEFVHEFSPAAVREQHYRILV
jgi:hypothetical protein